MTKEFATSEKFALSRVRSGHDDAQHSAERRGRPPPSEGCVGSEIDPLELPSDGPEATNSRICVKIWQPLRRGALLDFRSAAKRRDQGDLRLGSPLRSGAACRALP